LQVAVHGSGGDRSAPGVERELGRGSHDVRRPNKKYGGVRGDVGVFASPAHGVCVHGTPNHASFVGEGASGDGGRVLGVNAAVEAACVGGVRINRRYSEGPGYL